MEIILLCILIFFSMSLREFKVTPKYSESYRKIKTRFIVSSMLMGMIVASIAGIFMMSYITK